MTQTTTIVGRAKFLHPDLNFDTLDGGTALHAALTSLWTQTSNHLPTRYYAANTVANAAFADFTHNFGLAVTKLKFLFFESSTQLTAAQVAAKYTITQVSTNVARVTNISGGSLTFDLVVFGFQLGITSDDTDPSFSSVWDTTTVGGQTYKQSFYHSGAFSNATSPPEFIDVFIDGNYTVGFAQIIHGDLYVIGDLVNTAALTVVGSIYVTGNMNPSANITCGGNTVVLGGMTVNLNCILSMKGDCTLAGNVATASTRGLQWNISGDLTVNSCVAFSHVSGGFTCGGSVMSGGGFSIKNGSLTSAGTMIIGGSIHASSINFSGADNSLALVQALPGFALTVRGDIVSRGLVSTAGFLTGSAAGGAGGAITCAGNILAEGTIDTSGANAVSGPGNGGAGGNVTVGGNAKIANLGMITKGGIGGVSATASGVSGVVDIGGNVTTFSGSGVVDTTGPTSLNVYAAQSGGAIVIRGNAFCSILATGGNNGNAVGGAGGAVTIHGNFGGPSGSFSITSNGGTGNNTGAGAGGNIQIFGDCHRAANIASNGGSSIAAAFAGNAGNITIGGSAYDSNVSMVGGAAVSVTGTANAGNGGVLTVQGSFVGGAASTIATTGGAISGSTTGNAGIGGAVSIFGDCNCSTLTTSAGANSGAGTTSQNGGAIDVKGDMSGAITTAGSVVPTTAGAGGNSGAITVGGDMIGSITSLGKNGGTQGGKTGNVLIKGSYFGTVVLTAGNALANSGSTTGGNIGTGSAAAFECRGNYTGASFACTPGTATGASASPGVGGSYGFQGSTGSVVINGNVNVTGDFAVPGKDGMTAGGDSADLRIFGAVNVMGVLRMDVGEAANGTGNYGKLGVTHFLSGGSIGQFSCMIVSATGVYGGTPSTVFVSGCFNIRLLSIQILPFPVGAFFWKTNSSLIGAKGIPAQITTSGNDQLGGTDATDLLVNVLPRTAITNQSMILGKSDGTNTTWKYRLFNNT